MQFFTLCFQLYFSPNPWDRETGRLLINYRLPGKGKRWNRISDKCISNAVENNTRCKHKGAAKYAKAFTHCTLDSEYTYKELFAVVHIFAYVCHYVPKLKPFLVLELGMRKVTLICHLLKRRPLTNDPLKEQKL